jgi:acyl-coenzyme A thioesterase PaaI-like protein
MAKHDEMTFLTPMGSRWFPDDAPPEGQRAALYRLAAAVRETIALLADTEAGEAALYEAATALETYNARLGQAPRHRGLWGYAESSNAGTPTGMFDSSPIIGAANPLSPPLSARIVDGRVEATATFGTPYEGPPASVHGGMIAAAFDEVLGMAQSTTGAGGMTGTLTIKYRNPPPLHREVRFVGWVERVEGRKIFARGTLHAGEILCAEADAIFITVDFSRMQEMARNR